MRSHGSTLDNFDDMPKPDDIEIDKYKNQLLSDEKSYDQEQLRQDHLKYMSIITEEQLGVYNEILNTIRSNNSGIYFVYGFGGIGKTFLWRVLGAALRSKGDVVLNVASIGIASLLLEGGRTAHSRFGIPINVNATTMCSMKSGTHLAELIKETKLIIWDEAPMMSKHCFETLDRSMKDIMKCDELFGGKFMVFGGDFRQVLPVIPYACRNVTVMAALNASKLWDKCKVLGLTRNMRLHEGLSESDANDISSFSKWILEVGEGRINEPNSGETEIDIPEDLLIKDCDDPVRTIVKKIYGESFAQKDDPKFFRERTILAPKNLYVEKINEHMLSQVPGDERVYLSADSIDPNEKTVVGEAEKDPSDPDLPNDIVYTQEFLNSIKISGLPNHILILKIGAPIILLRNIDPKGGLCNGTRLIVTQLANHVIQARVITCKPNVDVDERVLIPRMFVTPADARLHFKMRRRQFPVSLAFAMTINKSQGQTLEKVGLYLPNPVFSHGQLYVAISRVTSRKGLKILITNNKCEPQEKTTNIVYKEVFENL